MLFNPTPEVPSLQYVGTVEEGGAAAEAGLKAGDFIVEVQVSITGFLHIFYTTQTNQYRSLHSMHLAIASHALTRFDSSGVGKGSPSHFKSCDPLRYPPLPKMTISY